jgi:hypothetical protein
VNAEPPTGPEPDPSVVLPADRAFLVQFRAGPAGGPAGQPAGRLEHLDSGRAARFGDWAGRRRFVEAVLGDRGPARPGDTGIPFEDQTDEP